MAKRPQRAEQKKKQIKIPKYLLDLYQKQTGTELPTSNLNLPGRHTRTANTVRTFYHQPGKFFSYATKIIYLTSCPKYNILGNNMLYIPITKH